MIRVKLEIIAILHNLRSAQNVGAIFRTADVAGFTKIYLTGYTPTPLDQFGRVNSHLAKSALGAEKTMTWEKRRQIGPLLKELKRQSIQIIALEQAPRARDYRRVKVKLPVAFIVGNEIRGLSPLLLKQVDVIAEIPLHGRKESLNVAVAFGIGVFRLLNL